MVQNGPNDHFGQNDLLPNWILAFARPKWTKMVHFGLKRSILVHLGPPTVLWPFLNHGIATAIASDFLNRKRNRKESPQREANSVSLPQRNRNLLPRKNRCVQFDRVDESQTLTANHRRETVHLGGEQILEIFFLSSKRGAIHFSRRALNFSSRFALLFFFCGFVLQTCHSRFRNV